MGSLTFPTVGIGRFSRAAGGSFVGLLVDEHVVAIETDDGGAATDLFEQWDQVWPELERRIDGVRRGRERGTPVSELKVLAPVLARQIVCVGANYRRHVIEMMADHEAGSEPGEDRETRRRRAEEIMEHRAASGAPIAIVKPFSVLAGPDEALSIPADSKQIDWELELAFIIGRPARRVSRDRAMEHVAGYTIANDISARDNVSRPDVPVIRFDWIAGKSGPGFLPIGPVIVPAALVPNPHDLQLTLHVNGELKQTDRTSDMIFDIPRIVEYLSTHMQLLPGDVVCTGSPAGNGTHFGRYLSDGDVMTGAIESLGQQRIVCAAEKVRLGAVLHKGFPAMTSA